MGYEVPLDYFAGAPYPALLKELMEGSKKIRIRKLDTASLNIKKFEVERFLIDERVLLSGVDGGRNGKECESLFLGAASAVSYTSPLREVVDRNPLSTGKPFQLDTPQGETWLSVIEHLMINEIAVKTVLQKRPDWMLVDGGLLLRPSYVKTQVSGVEVETNTTYRQHLESLIRRIIELIGLCKKFSIGLIGVVKRSRATLIDGKYRDVSICNRALKFGEATALPPGKHPALDLYEGLRRRWKMLPTLPPLNRDFFKIVYTRTSTSKGVIRLEIPYWVDVREAASVCLLDADPITGVPIHIEKADGLARISDSTFRSIHIRILHNNPDASEDLRPVRGEEYVLKPPEEGFEWRR